MMRDKIGSFNTKDNVSAYLNRWISQYILSDDNAIQAMKARFPLREARVDVYEVPGKPGSYRATVFLRPHFQLEELTASIRLVAELPPPAAHNSSLQAPPRAGACVPSYVQSRRRIAWNI